MRTPTLLITGASRGLGAAAARIAVGLGANVVINARSADELSAVAQRLRDAGGHAVAVPGDVSDPKACERLVAKAVERFGGLDGLVNNAGIIWPIAPLAGSEPAHWQQNVAVNLLGPMMLIQAALPHLRAAGGRVINVSSGAAASPIPGWSAYCASKAALNMLTAVLAREEPDITAVALRPGVVDTQMQAQIREEGAGNMPPADHQRFMRYHEQGELLDPDQPARALALLALRAPRELSGQFIAWDDARVAALEP